MIDFLIGFAAGALLALGVIAASAILSVDEDDKDYNDIDNDEGSEV